MPRAHYMQAHYYADYAHYATAALAPNARLTATAQSAGLLAHPEAMPLYPGMLGALDPGALGLLLKLAHEPPGGVTAITVDAACTQVYDQLGLSPQCVTAHLMWLLKQGFVVVE